MTKKYLTLFFLFTLWINIMAETAKTVTSIQEMTQLTNIEIAYLVTGTGVDGTFKWNSQSILPENGGTIFAPSSGGMGRWERVFNGTSFKVEWFGTPSATTIKAAIDAGAKEIIIPHGSYNWDQELEITAGALVIRAEPAGEYGANFNYTGPAGGTMLKWNAGWGGMKGIRLNGNKRANKIIHFGENAHAFHLEFSRMHFDYALSVGTQFGNYSTKQIDYDVSFITFTNCRWVGNYRQIVYDSTQALNINFINPDITGGSSTTDIARHIDMSRGGSATIISGHLGPLGNSGTGSYPIYVKDGWIEIFGLQNEGADGGGGLIEMGQATDPTSKGHTSELIRVRDFSVGQSGYGFKIKLHPGSNPLSVRSSWFIQRGVNQPTVNKVVRLEDSSAKFLSIGNTYYCNAESPWATGAISEIVSLGDSITRDGVNFSKLCNFINKRVSVNTQEYNLGDSGAFFACESGSSIFNLCPTLALPGREITIRNSKPHNGTITINTAGTDKINSALSSITLYRNDAVTLVSNGFSGWSTKSWSAGTNTFQTSSGVATVKTNSTNNAQNVGWLQIAPGKFVPYWTTPNP